MIQSTSSYDISDSGSSISSPITPSLSLSGDCTIQVSSIEEGPFHNSSRSWLGITDSEYAPIRTASPTSFFVDAKAAGAKDMQTERSVDALSVVAGSDPLLGLCGISYGFGSSGGPRLWHADVGHVSLEPTRVHWLAIYIFCRTHMGSMKGDDWLGIWCICLWYYYMINSSLFLSLSLTFLSSFCAIIIIRLQTKYHPLKKNLFLLFEQYTDFLPNKPPKCCFFKNMYIFQFFFHPPSFYTSSISLARRQWGIYIDSWFGLLFFNCSKRPFM